MAVSLNDDQVTAILAATAEEDDRVKAAAAVLGGANWILVVLLGPAGAALFAFGPGDPLWPDLNKVLHGPEGLGPPDALDRLAVKIAGRHEDDFKVLGDHGRAVLRLGARDRVTDDLRAAMSCA